MTRRSGLMTVVGTDHSHATSDDVTVVLFQPFDFAFDRSARASDGSHPSKDCNGICTTCLCRRGRLDVVIFEAVMRRLLGDPQRLASRAAERPIAAHRRPRTASIQGLQCAAKQTSRQGANAKLREFRLFPAKRGERSLVEPRKVRSFCPAVSIVMLLPTAREKQVQSWTVLSTSYFPRAGDPRTPAADLA
jgi:hypothetical protein